MTGGSSESRILQDIRDGSTRRLYLVTGETVVAEPAARRVAAALAQAGGGEVASYRRPLGLGEILADLRTFSLFGGAKVSLVLDSAALADRGAAAYLIDQAAEGLPAAESDSLSNRERLAAGRLLQVLRLFDFDSSGSPAELLAQLPDWVYQGGAKPGARSGRKKRRGKKQIETLLEGLELLLRAAQREDLQGWAETDLSDLSTLQTDGLPDGHCLVLCERSVARDHPVVARLVADQAVIEVATVQADRRGNWQGVEALVSELEAETGCAIEPRALGELVRRTLRQEAGWGRSGQSASADSTTRFAAEYRKLSSLALDGRIERELVEEVVQDRGQEDVFSVLDSVGDGRTDQALEKLRRLIDSAEDPMAVRLGLFSQLAQFCRHLTAVSGMVQIAHLPTSERSYTRFKNNLAAKLQQSLPGGDVKLLAGLHPYRLHRAYLAAARFSAPVLAALPAKVLETELRLKGESANPDAALVQLVSHLASAGRGATGRGATGRGASGRVA